MTKYSIVNEIDGATVAGEIAALQAANGKKAILVVEGPSDQRFFAPFVDDASCSIVISAGWENALNGLTIVRANGRSGVLVVLDLDYRHLLGTLQADPDVIYTAEHDIEIAMLSSAAFDKVLCEFGAPEKIDSFVAKAGNPREIIFQLARPMGALRLYAQEHGIPLKFDDYDYRHFKISMDVDISELIRVIFARSRIQLPRVSAVKAYIDARVRNTPDHYLCCGHDVCVSFGKSLQARLGSQTAQHVAGRMIERFLRLAYGVQEFLHTHLYLEIKGWESRNHPLHVLSV
jgi:hypothetical protein